MIHIDSEAVKATPRHAAHRIAKLAITMTTRVVLVAGIAAPLMAVFA